MQREPIMLRHAATLAAARAALLVLRPAALLLDLELPDGSGLDLIETPRTAGLDCAAIVITGHGSVNVAVEAMRAGAYDFLVKPVDAERLLTTLRNALERRRLAHIVEALGADLGAASFEGFIGADLSMQAVYRVINLAAQSRSTVFITGESGTGKERCASAAATCCCSRGISSPRSAARRGAASAALPPTPKPGCAPAAGPATSASCRT